MSLAIKLLKFKFGVIYILLFSILACFAEGDTNDYLFGDSFVGRGEYHSNQQYPAKGFDSGSVYDDARGTVYEWQFSKGQRVITRQVRSEEHGGSRGLFSIGRGF